MQDKNVFIYDPNDADFPNTSAEPVAKPVNTHPFVYAPRDEEHKLYKTQPCLLFDGTESLAAGLDQVGYSCIQQHNMTTDCRHCN